MNCALSELDLRRFGVVTAKADGLESDADFDAMMHFCASHKVALLITRINTNRLDLAQRLEARGGRLCDTLVYYELETAKAVVPLESPGDVRVRWIVEADRNAVLEIAREAFSGYHGHYHADARLKRADCDEVYVSWSESSIDNAGDVHNVLVIEDPSGVFGFVATRVYPESKLEIVVGGIRKQSSGRGGYRKLIEAGVREAARLGLARVQCSTQLPHLLVQRVWMAQGFTPVKSVHTFHTWFVTDQAPPREVERQSR